MKNSLIKFALYLCLPGLVCAATSTMRMATEDERDHRGRFYGNGFEEDHMGVYYRGSSRSDAFRGTPFSKDALGFVAKPKKKKINLDPEIRDRSSSTGSSSGSNSSSDSE